MAVLVTWMSFASDRKRIKRTCVEYARNSYRDEFLDLPPCSYSRVPPRSYPPASSCTFSHALPHTSSCALPQFAHMILVHERTALCLDALDMAHVLIVVIVSRVVLVFLLEGLILTLSQDIWTAHIFPIVVHAPLGQMVSWKGL
jgi:hypothetical protein